MKKKKEIMILAVICVVAIVAVAAVVWSGQSLTERPVTEESNETGGASEETEPESLEAVELPDFSVGLQDNGYFAGVDIAECVTLGTYKGIVVPKDEVTLSEEALEELINGVLSDHAQENLITNRAVMAGDVVYVDYTGSIDGVVNSKLSTGVSGSTIDLRDESLDPAYAEALVGAFCKDTVNVTVTLPDDYSDVALRGKTVDYEIKIHCIAEYEVPELDLEFVQKYYPQYASVEEFTAAQKETAENTLLQNYVWNAVAEQSQVEVPQQLIDNYAQLQLDMMAYTAYQTYGTTLEEYLAVNNYTENTFREDAAKEGKSRVTTQLLAQAICEAEQMELTEADAKTYLNYDEEAFAGICDSYGKGYAYQILLMNKVTAFLMENAIVQ